MAPTNVEQATTILFVKKGIGKAEFPLNQVNLTLGKIVNTIFLCKPIYFSYICNMTTKTFMYFIVGVLCIVVNATFDYKVPGLNVAGIALLIFVMLDVVIFTIKMFKTYKNETKEIFKKSTEVH